MEGKACINCGNKFKPIKSTQKYCSFQCNREYAKTRYIVEKICVICHKAFTAKSQGATMCSRECRLKKNEYKRLEYEQLQKIETCKQCNKEFIPKNVQSAIFCSKECSYTHFKIHLKTNKKDNIYCPVCNFECEDLRKECSNCLMRERLEKEMEAEYQELERRKKELEQQSIKTCEICNSFFKAKNENDLFCSSECKKKHSNMQRELRKGKRAELIVINGKIDEDITLARLIKRDKNICHICNLECDKKDYTRDENKTFIAGNAYPSIDHLIALINGGTHTWDNIKLAHRLCNSQKGGKEDFLNKVEQLILF